MSETLGTLFKYLLALLGVAAVVLIFHKVLGSDKSQRAISDVMQLQANVQGLYGTQNNFTTLTNTVAINGELAPKSMISGTALINPWNGAVSVAVNSGNAAQYDINSADIPAGACATYARSFPSAVALRINSTAQTMPMEAGAAVAACSGTTNSVTLTFAS